MAIRIHLRQNVYCTHLLVKFRSFPNSEVALAPLLCRILSDQRAWPALTVCSV